MKLVAFYLLATLLAVLLIWGAAIVDLWHKAFPL